MKKVIFLFSVLSALLITSCSVAKEAGFTGDRQADETLIRQAVESKRFIVKLEKLYTFGGMLFLRPRSNYIIVDGRNAVINTAYIGRQYDIRPIAGINMRGNTTDYEVTNKVSKGTYQIKMKVGNGANSFDVFLNIDKRGSVSASVNSLKIENTRYFGYIVPIPETEKAEQPSNDLI